MGSERVTLAKHRGESLFRHSSSSILYVFIGEVLSKVLLALTGLYLIRFMDRGEFATYTMGYATAIALSQVVSTPCSVLLLVGRRGISISAASPFLLVIQIMLLAVLALISHVLRGVLWDGYLWASLLAGALCSAEYARTKLRAKLQFFRYSLLELGRIAGFAIATMMVTAGQGGSIRASQVFVIHTASTCAILLVFLPRIMASCRQTPLARIWHGVSSSLKGHHKYLLGYQFIMPIMSQMDVFVTNVVGNTYDLATLGSALRYYGLISIITSSVHIVLLPVTQTAESHEDITLIYRRYSFWGALVAVGVAGAGLVSPWLIPLVDEGRYPDAPSVFMVYCVSGIMSLLLSPYVNVLFRHEDFKFLFFLASATVALHMGLSLVLASFIGALGAALSQAVSFGILNISIFLRGQRVVRGVGHCRLSEKMNG